MEQLKEGKTQPPKKNLAPQTDYEHHLQNKDEYLTQTQKETGLPGFMFEKEIHDKIHQEPPHRQKDFQLKEEEEIWDPPIDEVGMNSRMMEGLFEDGEGLDENLK